MWLCQCISIEGNRIEIKRDQNKWYQIIKRPLPHLGQHPKLLAPKEVSLFQRKELLLLRNINYGCYAMCGSNVDHTIVATKSTNNNNSVCVSRHVGMVHKVSQRLPGTWGCVPNAAQYYMLIMLTDSAPGKEKEEEDGVKAEL